MLIIFILIALFVVFLLRIKKSPLFKYLALIIFSWLILEVGAYGYLLSLIQQGKSFFLIGNQVFLDQLIKLQIVERTYLSEKKKYTLFQIDKDTGYILGKNKFQANIQASNSQGVRSLHEYSFIPSSDKLRMAVFGDSFVFGDGEYTPSVWPNILEHSLKNLEVLNLGMSGYGLGQSYLRYLRDGLRFNPDIIFFNYVILGSRDKVSAHDVATGRGLMNADLYRVRFWLEDNMIKTESVSPMDFFNASFRKKYIYDPLQFDIDHSLWASKIFSVSNVALLIKQAALGKELSGRKVPSSEEYDLNLNLKILENLVAEAKRNKSTIIFFYKKFADLPATIQQFINNHLNRIVYVDSDELMNALFKKHHVQYKELMNETNHYNKNGNVIYAEALAIVLIRRGIWGAEDRTFRFDEKTRGFVRILE